MTVRDQATPLLVPAPVRAPEHLWKGVFHVNAGNDKGDQFHVTAQIGFHGDLIEGAGRAFDEDGRGGGRDMTISGASAGGAVGLQLWLEADEFAHLPFDCAGALSADGTVIDGHWAYTCGDPAGCDCGGGGGTFRLQRVQD